MEAPGRWADILGRQQSSKAELSDGTEELSARSCRGDGGGVGQHEKAIKVHRLVCDHIVVVSASVVTMLHASAVFADRGVLFSRGLHDRV